MLIPKPPYPNVPLTTGVPALPRIGGVVTQIRSIFGILETGAWDRISRQTEWGIFKKNGDPVAIADSVLTMDYRNESRISTFPVQNGSFANYNKVNNPYEVIVTLCKGSNNDINPINNSIINNGNSAVGRGDFLKAIDDASKSLELFNVVTPERNYINANIIGYDYRREVGNGCNMLIVELHLIEIREVTAKYATTKEPTKDTTNAKEPQSKPSVNHGRVQPSAPRESMLSKAVTYIKGLF